ncbi:MAG: ABC transporter substrate-binding protein [Pseudomonadota bacterium]
MRDAMMITESDIHAAGGVLGCEVEVMVGDSEGLSERATALMERLITRNSVLAVGGGYHSSVGEVSNDVADARGIQVVFAETWDDTITGDKQKYILRIAPLSSWATGEIWPFALTLPDVAKVAILTEDTDCGIPADQETAAGFGSGGVDSVIFSVDIGRQDHACIVERIKAESPDRIIMVVTGEVACNFTQQAADADIGPLDLPFVTDQEALESGSYWTNLPDGQYAFEQRIGVPETQFTVKGNAFAAAYEEEIGRSDVESYAMEAYDSMAILAQAISEAVSTDGDAIVAALKIIEHDGTLGKIYFPYGTPKDRSADGKGDEWWRRWPDPAITLIQ